VSREIARGGMGAILEANDESLDREVAMKVLLEAAEQDQVARQRFLREALGLARLPHPNIVPIHDMGRDEQGRRFHTMKLVKGRTLQAILTAIKKGNELTTKHSTLDRLLAIYRKVCDAVAVAHHQRIIHRDLKPENVRVGEFGEVLVMDANLAKPACQGSTLVQALHHGAAQLVQAERLGQGLHRPELFRQRKVNSLPAEHAARHRQDAHPRLPLRELRDQLHAVHVRHEEVRDHQVGGGGIVAGQRLLAACHPCHLILEPRERLADHRAAGRVVFHEQDTFHTARWSGRRLARADGNNDVNSTRIHGLCARELLIPCKNRRLCPELSRMSVPPTRPPVAAPRPLAHVLHIEDQPAVTALVRLELLRDRISVIAVATGEEGLQLARQIRFDLILLDDGLPGLSGLEVCQRLQADPLTRPIPILFLSGGTDPRRRAAALGLGAAGWLVKGETQPPLAPQILAEVRAFHARHPRQFDWPPPDALPSARPAP
jgi:CheY-like chemotaxis protein